MFFVVDYELKLLHLFFCERILVGNAFNYCGIAKDKWMMGVLEVCKKN